MAESTDSAGPTWWNEIAEDLAHLQIAGVTVTDTGTQKQPAWTAVVILHADHLCSVPQVAPGPHEVCLALPWAFAARASEAEAWKAAEVFLRGLAAVRAGTKERAPWAQQAKTAAAMKRRTTRVYSAVESWHDRHHHGPTAPAGATV